MKLTPSEFILVLTDPLTMNVKDEEKVPNTAGPSTLPTRSNTPPGEEDEYTLTAFGDISLSDIDFIPGPPDALTPIRKIRRENKRSFPAIEPKLPDFVEGRPRPAVIRKVLPPAPSKESIGKPETSFEMMVLNLKQSREEGKLRLAPDVASGKYASEIDVHAPQPRRLIELKNFGIDMEIGKAHSHDIVENSTHMKRTGAAKRATTDENGASPALATNPKPNKNALRGNGKLPKRPPIPRWDVDNNLGSRGEYHLGLSSSPFTS